MQRTTVSSSNIASIGYDASSQVLEVQFRSGSIYQYSDVPASVHQALMMASSHGSYRSSPPLRISSCFVSGASKRARCRILRLRRLSFWQSTWSGCFGGV
jgi:hypothetical protein